MNVTYTFYLDNVGLPKTGATPFFQTFIDIDSSIVSMNGGGGVENVAGINHPEIKELEGGFYYFQFDWSQFSGNSYLVNINCGDETQFADPKQRFIILKLERNDNLYNMIDAVETSSTQIVDATTTLLKSINRLLEIEQGTWKIEDINGIWYLNLYSTEDSAAPGQALFETTLDPAVPFASYRLQDIDGITTNTNAMKRIFNNVTSLP